MGISARVGDGTQINIWDDNWILSSHNRKVLTLIGDILVSMVDELNKTVDDRWDEELMFTLKIWKESAGTRSFRDLCHQ